MDKTALRGYVMLVELKFDLFSYKEMLDIFGCLFLGWMAISAGFDLYNEQPVIPSDNYAKGFTTLRASYGFLTQLDSTG